MDIHLVVKIIHMTSVALALLIFVLRALTLFVGTQGQQPNPNGRVAFVALQHLSYTVVVVTGVVLLFMKHFDVQPWFYAKIILFLVLLSSQIKVYKKDENILLAQRRAGLVVGSIDFIGLITLVMIKPVFS